jgi:hypothetical protein
VVIMTVFVRKDTMANQIPLLLPGFQQFGEKECGKAKSCAGNRTQAACFVALHWIRCEDE